WSAHRGSREMPDVIMVTDEVFQVRFSALCTRLKVSRKTLDVIMVTDEVFQVRLSALCTLTGPLSRDLGCPPRPIQPLTEALQPPPGVAGHPCEDPDGAPTQVGPLFAHPKPRIADFEHKAEAILSLRWRCEGLRSAARSSSPCSRARSQSAG